MAPVANTRHDFYFSDYDNDVVFMNCYYNKNIRTLLMGSKTLSTAGSYNYYIGSAAKTAGYNDTCYVINICNGNVYQYVTN